MDKKQKSDEGLPSELISEILSRLPVKSLSRFRLVSKPWNELTSSNKFQKDHYRRNAEQGPLMLTACPNIIDEDTPSKFLHLTIRDNNAGTRKKEKFSIKLPVRPTLVLVGPVQCCQGLVCISYAFRIFLINPATREVIKLSSSQSHTHCSGFGYDEVKDEFKVVRFFTTDKSHCEVFSLGSVGWRDVVCPPLSCWHINKRAPFVNGAVHVLSDSKKRNHDVAIYGFNIQSEDFNKIRLPVYYYVVKVARPRAWASISLNELRGCLCLTFCFDTKLDVWMLKDYENVVWERVYTIETPSYEFVWGEPLVITVDGTVLLQIFEEVKDLGELHWYDPNDEEYYGNAKDNCMATLYVESLFSLGGGPVLDESSDSDESSADDDEDYESIEDDEAGDDDET